VVSSQSRDKGLIRVPFDGPPMRITPFVTDIVCVLMRSIDSWNVYEKQSSLSEQCPNASMHVAINEPKIYFR